jgi:hypothetical protein
LFSASLYLFQKYFESKNKKRDNCPSLLCIQTKPSLMTYGCKYNGFFVFIA